MLDNIDGAGVPYNFIEYTLMTQALERLWNGEKTIGEIAEWMNVKIERYRNEIQKMKPYCDVEHEMEILRE